MSEYAAQRERPPFAADGRLVARRAIRNGDRVYQLGEEVPVGDMTPRQVAVLWDQGWIDTLPAAPASKTASVSPAAPQPQQPPPPKPQPSKPPQPNPLLTRR